jgi:hypothetical protein
VRGVGPQAAPDRHLDREGAEGRQRTTERRRWAGSVATGVKPDTGRRPGCFSM